MFLSSNAESRKADDEKGQGNTNTRTPILGCSSQTHRTEQKQNTSSFIHCHLVVFRDLLSIDTNPSIYTVKCISCSTFTQCHIMSWLSPSAFSSRYSVALSYFVLAWIEGLCKCNYSCRFICLLHLHWLCEIYSIHKYYLISIDYKTNYSILFDPFLSARVVSLILCLMSVYRCFGMPLKHGCWWNCQAICLICRSCFFVRVQMKHRLRWKWMDDPCIEGYICERNFAAIFWHWISNLKIAFRAACVG